MQSVASHRRRQDLLAVAGLAVLTLLLGLPLLLNLHHTIPIEHFGTGRSIPPRRFENYVFAAVDRLSILRYGQFPLWSPHLEGGYPMMGYPDEYGLSPRLLPVLAVGEIGGLKIDFLVTQMLGAIGLYLLTRRVMGLGVAGSLVAATCFAFGALTGVWVRGDPEVIRHALTPLILFLIYTAGRRPWRLLGAALLMAWIVVDQKYSILYALWFMVLSAVFLRAFEQTPDRRGPNWRVLVLLMVAAGWAALLMLGKLVAMWPLIRRHSRSVWAEGNLNTLAGVVAWGALASVFTLLPRLRRLRGVADAAVRQHQWALRVGLVVLLGVAVAAMPPGRYAHTRVGVRRDILRLNTEGVISQGTLADPLDGLRFPVEVFRFEPPGPPVGHVGFVLAIVGLVAAPRRFWRWGVLAILFAWITVGPVLPVDLTAATRSLPMLNSCRRPLEHLFIYRALCLSVLAGAGAYAIGRLAGSQWRTVSGIALVALNAALLAYITIPRLTRIVSGPVPEPPAPGRFYQVRGSPYWLDRQLVCQNVGRINECTSLSSPFRTAVQPRFIYAGNGGSRRLNLDYQGEVYFKHSPDENVVTWPESGFSPNRWTFHVDVKKPDILIVNQVYDPYWRCDAGRIMFTGGLMAVALRRRGKYEVHMRYVPTHYFTGLAVGGASLLIGIAILSWITLRRRKRQKRGHSSF